MDYIIHILPNMIQGLGVSAKIFLFTIVLSLPIGVLLAMVRISKGGAFPPSGRYVHLRHERHASDAADHVHLLWPSFDAEYPDQ